MNNDVIDLIKNMNPNIEKLRDKFKYTNIYYCGSYTCCSCGFGFDFSEEEDEDDRNENLWGKKSLEEMFSFFRNKIESLNEIEMFICWEGDEDCKPEQTRRIELSKFKFDQAFNFNELEYIQFIK